MYPFAFHKKCLFEIEYTAKCNTFTVADLYFHGFECVESYIFRQIDHIFVSYKLEESVFEWLKFAYFVIATCIVT